jgi:hypothetical protein
MTDFFISHTGVDQAWAEWISYVLDEEDFSVIIQAWDFRPGNNFVLEMQKAASEADRTIMVLSPDYLKSQFASPEWAATFGQDPKGLEQKLVPVMVRSCQPQGLLTAIFQIRIAALTEVEARRVLLAGIDRKRAKPSSRPAFPCHATQVEYKEFPGPSGGGQPLQIARPGVVPALNVAPSDMDKRRFVKQGFETIKSLFEHNAGEASRQEPRIHLARIASLRGSSPPSGGSPGPVSDLGKGDSGLAARPVTAR